MNPQVALSIITAFFLVLIAYQVGRNDGELDAYLKWRA